MKSSKYKTCFLYCSKGHPCNLKNEKWTLGPHKAKEVEMLILIIWICKGL